MTDLDRALHDTLTRVADDDVHVDRLLAGARAKGVRYRRRRNGIAAGAGLTAGAAALVLTMTVLSANGGPSSAPAVGSSPSAPVSAAASASRPSTLTTWPLPPDATGSPTAAGSAGAVGEPLRFHLSLAGSPFPLVSVQYQQHVDEKQESLFITGVDRFATVRLGASTRDFEPLSGERKTVDVAGRPGTFATRADARGTESTLRWRTANGLWLQVYGARAEAEAVALAASVRIDRTFRCVVPYRLGPLPAGTGVESCTMVFTGGGVDMTGLSVSDGRFHALIGTGAGQIGVPTEEIAGRPARATEHAGDGGAQIMELYVDRGDNLYVDVTASGRYDRTVIRRLMTDLVWVGGPDPTRWPENPLTG